MPQLILSQHNLSGTDSDGSHDGRYVKNVSPAGAYNGGSEYELIADATVGHFNMNGVEADICHWLRFKLPLNKNADVNIVEAMLRLYWNPRLDLDVDDSERRANVNNENVPMGIVISLYPSDDAPIPSSAADAISKQGAALNEVNWQGGQLANDPGIFETVVWTGTFCFESSDLLIEEATIRRSAWVKDGHILIFLEPYVPSSLHRLAHFRSWSWIKNEIAQGNLPSTALSTAPTLFINYEIVTPGKSLGDAHVEHELTIEQSIDGYTLSKTVEHTLDIQQDISTQVDFNRTIEHTLILEQDVAYVGIVSGTLEHVLDFEQTIFYQVVRAASTVYNEVTFEQTITVGKVFGRIVEHTLDIEQDITPSGVINKSVEHALTFEQTITTTGSTIANPTNVEHTLIFEQDVSRAGSEYSRTFEHTLTIIHVYTGYIEGTSIGVCQRKDLKYDPAKKPTSSFPAEPTITPQGQLVLEYPTTSPTHTVTLPQPLLSNREELEATRIQRKTRGGDLKTYVDTSWPITEIFRFKFQDLTDAQKLALFTFTGVSLAQKVKLTDHEGRIWNGVIINPNGEYTQVFRDCGHTAEFDFQVTDGPL